RGVVSGHSPGSAAAQGPALLSPARRKRRDRIHRLRLRAEPAGGRIGRAAAPPAGRRHVHDDGRRPLSAEIPGAALTPCIGTEHEKGGARPRLLDASQPQFCCLAFSCSSFSLRWNSSLFLLTNSSSWRCRSSTSDCFIGGPSNAAVKPASETCIGFGRFWKLIEVSVRPWPFLKELTSSSVNGTSPIQRSGRQIV